MRRIWKVTACAVFLMVMAVNVYPAKASSLLYPAPGPTKGLGTGIAGAAFIGATIVNNTLLADDSTPIIVTRYPGGGKVVVAILTAVIVTTARATNWALDKWGSWGR